MQLAVSSFFSHVADIFAPPRESESIVRALTLSTLRELRSLDTLALPYHDPRVTALVWEMKYHANRRAIALGGALLSEQLLDIASEELGTPLLIPIPMHRLRRSERGHNQTELLCEKALRRIEDSYEYAPGALEKVVHTASQQRLPERERRRNLVGSMTARPRVEGRVCVIVDDVLTTGATLKEARRAVLAAGARGVHCVALAYS